MFKRTDDSLSSYPADVAAMSTDSGLRARYAAATASFRSGGAGTCASFALPFIKSLTCNTKFAATPAYP